MIRDPESVRAEVKAMMHTPGWAHVVALFDRKIEDLRAKGMNPRTNDADTLLLKRVAEQLENLKPATLAKELVTSAENAVRRE